MSQETCATVQIQTEPSEVNPSGIVVINESDFNAETMTLVDKQLVPLKSEEPPVKKVEALVPKQTGKAAKVVAPWAA